MVYLIPCSCMHPWLNAWLDSVHFLQNFMCSFMFCLLLILEQPHTNFSIMDDYFDIVFSLFWLYCQVQSSVQAPPAAVSKTPQRKASGQKKPLEALGSSPPPSRYVQCLFSVKSFNSNYFLSLILLCSVSKKQKTSGGFHEQSIDQLNDVTAVSGVNLRVHDLLCFCCIYLVCDAICYLLFDEFLSNNSLCHLPGRRGTTFLCSKGRESSFRSCSESCSTRRRKAHSTEGTADKEISRNQLVSPSFKFYLIKQSLLSSIL